MKIINLTPHNVDICDENGNIIKTYEASGIDARMTFGYDDVDVIDGVPMVVRTPRRIKGLPSPQKDTMFIVSNIIMDACPDRKDLLAPVKQVRINGRVVGCQALLGNR